MNRKSAYNCVWPKPDVSWGLTEHQVEELSKALTHPIGILGGNPGVGKTHCLAKLIWKCAESLGNGKHPVGYTALGAHSPIADHISVAAPTGKAAVRLNEKIAERPTIITNQQHAAHWEIEATTQHRMLGPTRNGHDGDGWAFAYNAKNRLGSTFIFLDEQSMDDVDLTSKTLTAAQNGAHILFTGDVAQLPPVGHGRPLYDLIAAGLPYGELSVPMRFGGDILRICADLKAMRTYVPSSNINLATGQNVLHIEASRPQAAIRQLVSLFQNLPSQYNPMDDVQVICAVNEHTPFSRDHLNRTLQNVINPPRDSDEESGGTRFRLRDKVVCTSNGFLPLAQCPKCGNALPGFLVWKGAKYACGLCGEKWTAGDGAQIDFVANGEIGKVAYIEKGMAHITIDRPQRTVRVAGELLEDWVLAYALSCHRAQGSQWPVVIVMLDDSNSADRVTSFEWHRTAVSRAEQMVVTIGKLSTIHRQCKRSALADRKTFLKELLCEV